LTVRGIQGRNPFRILIDGRLRTPLDAVMFNDKYRSRTLVFFGDASTEKAQQLKAKGVLLSRMKGKDGIIPLTDILAVLAGRGIASLLVEGGQSIYKQFLKERLADKIYFFISPKKFGEGLSAFGDDGPLFRMKRESTRKTGGDNFIEGRISYPKTK
jgi:riboflavin biosynthesis pyrimidine reductase